MKINSSVRAKNALINTSSNFVKVNFNLVRYLLLAIFAVIIVLSGYIYYLIASLQAPPVYIFDKKSASRVVTLDLPKISNEAVLRWASQAVSDIYSFNFSEDLNKHFERVSEYFTNDGYKQYMESLNSSGLIIDAKTKDIFYTANSCDVVSVSNQIQVSANDSANTIWYVDIPLLIKVESSGPVVMQRYIVRTIIKGGDDVRADKSIGFLGIEMRQAGRGVCAIGKYA